MTADARFMGPKPHRFASQNGPSSGAPRHLPLPGDGKGAGRSVVPFIVTSPSAEKRDKRIATTSLRTGLAIITCLHTTMNENVL
jgi:hypothetical protein